MKIFISPSSQENNVYTTGTNEEVVLNLIADSLCPELTRHGVEWQRNKKTGTYADHVIQSDLYKPAIHLAIHSNAGSGKVRGCEVYVFNPYNLTSLGTQLGKAIYTRISTITPSTDRGIKAGTMAEVKQVKAPACLIELSYHDNPEDAVWIVTHIAEISNALLLSILEVFNSPYKPIIPLPDKAEKLRGEMKRIKLIVDEALR